jgi:hypothetical protein
MPFAYRISQGEDQVRLVGKGRLTAADCIGVVKRVLADPRCHPESTALIDLRGALYDALDTGEVIRIAKTIEGLASMFKSNVAIVAKGGMILPAELLCTHVRRLAHIPMKVFAELAAAEAFCRSGTLPAKLAAKGAEIGRN